MRSAALPSEDRAPSWISPELVAAIESGWRATYSLLFDKHGMPFVGVLAWHHRQAIMWHWVSRHRLCLGLVARFLAYFSIWSRGHMKSSVAKRIAVVDAVLAVYYAKGGYCLYVSGTEAKIEKHSISIDKLLQESVRVHVPALAEVNKATEGGRTLGWKATFFYTRAGYVFHFGSLQSGLAGGNVDDVRPTLIILDDIDDRADSPVISETNFKLLTTEILPMGSQGTLTFWAQNLISRFSAMYRITEHKARVLVDRKPTKPIPAIVGMETELRTVGGIPRDVIVAGKPTWNYFDLAACQDEMNRIGLPAFLRECNHEVKQSMEGLMLHSYNDRVHVISVSEFASVFHTRTMPVSWPKQWGNDWARTKSKYHANVAMWQTVSPQNGPLPGFTFYWHPMSFKANTPVEDVAERVLSCLAEKVTREHERGVVVQRFEKLESSWAELRRDELIRANALAHTNTGLERIEFERSVLQEIIPQYSEPLLRLHNVRGGVVSHEREDNRLIYNAVYALKARSVPITHFGGVEQMVRDFRIDFTVEHPFRPGVMGYTRTFIVVPDDTSVDPVRVPVFVNGEPREAVVYPPEPYPDALSPDDLHDDKLIRHQFMNWRVKEAKLIEGGEKVDEVLKMDDDFGALLQMFTLGGALDNTPLTVAEEHEMVLKTHLPERMVLTDGSVRIKSKQDQHALEFAEAFTRAELEEKHGDLDEVYDPEFFAEEESPWWE